MQRQHWLAVGVSVAVLAFWQGGAQADSTTIEATSAEAAASELADVEAVADVSEQDTSALKAKRSRIGHVQMQYLPDTQDWLLRLAVNDLQVQQVLPIGYPGWPGSQVGKMLAFDLGLREPLAYQAGLPWPNLDLQQRNEDGKSSTARWVQSLNKRTPRPIFRVDPKHERLVVSYRAEAGQLSANPIAPKPRQYDEPRLGASSVHLPQPPSAPMPSAIWAGMILFVCLTISRVRKAHHAAT